ncbi:hypothetical protein QQ045_006902 [Rhodiola kirilowii]
MEAGGCFYTCSNKDSIIEKRIWCKLDRIMGNLDWKNSFHDVSAVFYRTGVSDHSLLMLSLGSKQMVKRPFKYCNFWEHFDNYRNTVETAWNYDFSCKNLFALQDKLKRMKEGLKEASFCKADKRHG